MTDYIQPTDIEELLEDKKIFDEMGWTGEYHLSLKDILDLILDLTDKKHDEK